MKVLVIGANGFLGRHIVKLSLMREWETHGLVHIHRNHVPEGCKVIPNSDLALCDTEYDLVFITAGNFRDDDRELVETNIRLVSSVANRFMDSRIIFVSSTMIYGVQSGVITEDSPIVNPTDYGLAKVGGEMTLRSHPNSSIVRLTAMYGPGMDNSIFIPNIIRMAKEDRKISILGDGTRKQNYLHVKDAAVLTLEAALYEKPGVFLGTDSRSYTNNEIAVMVLSRLPGTEIVHDGIETRPNYEFDNTKTRTTLSWSPAITMEDGITEMVSSA